MANSGQFHAKCNYLKNDLLNFCQAFNLVQYDLIFCEDRTRSPLRMTAKCYNLK